MSEDLPTNEGPDIDAPDPKLAEEIKAFTTQEVIHSREHLAFNRRAADAGYDLSKLDQRVEIARKRRAVDQRRGPGLLRPQ